jgi:hypothetical protein
MKKLFFLFFVCQSWLLNAQIVGCTDPMAVNYNAQAIINDGSCTYLSTSINPLTSVLLDSCLLETSGLTFWNNLIWTINDDTDTSIYGLDSLSGLVSEKITLPNVTNHDWEEISQDSNYFYIGDFGNNATGNRTDLKILRISKNSFLSGVQQIDTIAFSYSTQTDFTNQGSNNTDFDCEAFIVGVDSIYLLTKQWVGLKTTVFSIPKTPGIYFAQPKDSLDVGGLITAATYLESKKIVVLTGYSKTLSPFFYLLYDFQDHNFFSGNKRKVDIGLSYHQIEGVTTTNGLTVYCSNEKFTYGSIINNPQKLHTFDLSSILGYYICSDIGRENIKTRPLVHLFPNPTSNILSIFVSSEFLNHAYTIVNSRGRTVLTGKILTENTIIDVNKLKTGCYFVKLEGTQCTISKFIKR